MPERHPPTDDAAGRGFEGEDVSARRAALWGYGLFGVAMLVSAIVYGLWLLLQQLEVRPPASPVEQAPVVPPEPRLQTSPEDDLAKLRAAEQQRLDGVGWVDRDKGIVHIPVERAMRLLAERGWPKPEEQEGGK
jgi:hypothetical protein